jgi:two-component system response regulator QseB
MRMRPSAGLSDLGTDSRPRLLLIGPGGRTTAPVREALDEPYLVTCVSESDDALLYSASRIYDAIVIRHSPPLLDGIRLVRMLRDSRLSTPVLLIAVKATVQDKIRGLDAGANDYVLEPFDVQELLARLRALRRDYGRGLPFIRINAWEVYPERRTVYSPYDGRIMLTERESSLLSLLAKHPDHTYSRQQILHEVFADTDEPGTVDTYVHYVRKKTDPDMITTVRGLGYRLGEL